MIRPFLVASFAALICWSGWLLLEGNNGFSFAWSGRRKSADRSRKLAWSRLGLLVLTTVIAFVICFLLSQSSEISLAIASLSTALPWLMAKKKMARKLRNREGAWPVAIENVVSALHAGTPIAESIRILAQHSPENLRDIWIDVDNALRHGGNFEEVLRSASTRLNSGRADQFFLTLIFAKEYGGTSVQRSLRFLANFIREEQQVIEEIETKFGWVRNSAVLAAIAPWILLLILSSQPTTVTAYSTDGGRIILSLGVIATAVAYLWMERISRLPIAPRLLDISSQTRDKV